MKFSDPKNIPITKRTELPRDRTHRLEPELPNYAAFIWLANKTKFFGIRIKGANVGRIYINCDRITWSHNKKRY